MSDPPTAPDGASPIPKLVVQHRRDKSLPMHLLHTVIKPFRPRLVKVKDRRVSSRDSPRLTPPPKLQRDFAIRERRIEGIWIYDVSKKLSNEGSSIGNDQEPRNSAQSSRRIYYFAGGGWQMPPTAHHWALAAALSKRLPQTTLSLISYPLAPGSPVSVSLPQLKSLYETLMLQSSESNERVIIAGDSSGGNIALSLVFWALASEQEGHSVGAHHPAAIMAISPSTDLRHDNLDIEVAARQDPTLTASFINSTAAAWCGTGERSSRDHNGESAEWTAEDPRVSPVLAPIHLASARGIQIHGVIGTHDVLAPEALAFMEKCRQLGVEGSWLVWEGQMHCFPLASSYGLRESAEAVDWIVDVLGKI